MVIKLKKSYAFHLAFGMLLLTPLISCVSLGATEELSSSTTMEPESVRRCYKCEGECHGKIGTVEECHPDTDAFTFACYKIVVDGRTFQRGCTRDFSDGEDCVAEKGRKYCFCRKDECNGSNSLKFSGIVVLFGLVISRMSSE